MTFGIKSKIQILKHQLSLFLCKTVSSFQSEFGLKTVQILRRKSRKVGGVRSFDVLATQRTKEKCKCSFQEKLINIKRYMEKKKEERKNIYHLTRG